MRNYLTKVFHVTHQHDPKSVYPLDFKPICLWIFVISNCLPAPSRATDYTLSVDAGKSIGATPRFWQEAIGSDHIYMTLNSAQRINFKEHFALGASELGMKRIRAHGLLNDDVGIYKEANGVPVYNWRNFDSIMDYLVSIKMEPVVELSFMPAALASGPNTFGWYNNVPGNITPPKDYAKWMNLCHEVAKHAVDRYGAVVVEKWYWEIWNEPDLAVFWSGTQQDYFKLYDYAVEGLLKAIPNARVGGPSSAISGGPWIEAFIEHCMTQNLANTAKQSARVNFISWHTYPGQSGQAIVAGAHNSVVARITAKQAKYPQLQVENLLTEWNTSYQGGNTFNNEIGASFVAKVVHSLFPDQNNGLAPPDMASFWVISDIWEEWDVTSSLAFGPMGLILRKYNVRKPPYLAFQMLAKMSDTLLEMKGGTKADLGLNGFATLDKVRQKLQILIYDHNRGNGDDIAQAYLDKGNLTLTGIPADWGAVKVTRFGVDRTHNNAYRVWEQSGKPALPSEAHWAELAKVGKLNPVTDGFQAAQSGASLSLQFDQYQPGVSLFEISGERGVSLWPGPASPSLSSPGMRLRTQGKEMVFSGIPPGVERVDLVDLRGRLVRTLPVDADRTVRWDLREASGSEAKTGLLVARLMRSKSMSEARVIFHFQVN